MRVISGQARGLKLKAPSGLETRPTTDRIKESFFNIISPELYDADFLDLFSGSGGIGIEALSRGASSAVFVDFGNESIEVINDNLTRARLADKAEVIKGNVLSVIASLGTRGRKFDIIFMDPPYSQGLVEAALAAIHSADILKEGGFIVAEQSVDEPALSPVGFEAYRIKDYKRTTKMTFLKRDSESAEENK
jgi:16S rRNA (guanine(966)-N(2))-methyltransferase RsmD